MARIRGTDGDDNLTGTRLDDYIYTYLGHDQVDGGAGHDVLTVDYSAVADAYFPASIGVNEDGTIGGAVQSGNARVFNYVGFRNVERLAYTASQGDDTLALDLGTIALDNKRFRLDGGAGNDTLELRGSSMPGPIVLKVASDGSIVSNAGVFLGWETFDIGLNKVAGNRLVLGGGNDTVHSLGGIDTIEMGAGADTWQGWFGDRTDDLVYSFGLATGAKVSAAGKTIASVTGVETAYVALGSGNDTVDLWDGGGSVDGGAGNNMLTLHGVDAIPLAITLDTTSTGDLHGRIAEKVAPTPIDFTGFGTVSLTGSSGDDSLVLDAATRAIADKGYDVTFDGADGVDDVTLDLQADAPAYIAGIVGETPGPGFATVTWLGKTNVLALRNIEALTVNFGSGDDFVEPDTARTLTADGGAGVDTINFGFATAGITLDLRLETAQATGADEQTVTLRSIERLYGSGFGDRIYDSAAANNIAAGDGNDTVYSTAGGSAADRFDGGNRNDTIDYSFAPGGVTMNLALTTAQDTGGAGTETLTGFENIRGSAVNDVLTGNAGANAITGGLGTDTLTGGGGADRFIFRSVAESTPQFLTADTITDFKGPTRVSGDVIDLSGIDAIAGTPRFNDAFTFIGSAAFSGTAGELRVSLFTDGVFLVSGDTNGDKNADFAIYVQTTDTAMNARDFVF